MAEKVEVISLGQGEQLCVILEYQEVCHVDVSNGVGFCHGRPIPDLKKITFRNEPFSIETASGCAVRISGQYSSYYVSPVNMEQKQVISHIGDLPSPSVTFVVGAPGTGKTTFCKELANYIGSKEKCPIYISADPSQNPVSPPGCITAIPIATPIDNRGFPFFDALCYFYGSLTVEEDRLKLYLGQLGEMRSRVQSRRQAMDDQDGGVVVDFPGITANGKSDTVINALYEAIGLFSPSQIVVFGNDDLYRKLKDKYSEICIAKLPKSPDAYQISWKNELRDSFTRRYFYGDEDNELNPTTHILQKKDIDLCSLGAMDIHGTRFKAATLMSEKQDPLVAYTTQFSRITEDSGAIFAVVTHAQKPEIWKQNALGFLHLIGKPGPEELNVLKPNRVTDLPSKVLIVNNIKWQKK